MFWKSTSSTTVPSPSRRPSISRDEHLKSYLDHPVLKPSTRKVSNNDTMYDTVFQTTNGFALILRVYVPSDGRTSPTMHMHGVRASHLWLDIRMKVIGYSPVSSDQAWRNANLKLGDAVYAVIHHFQLTPPSIQEITDQNLRKLQQTLSPSRDIRDNNHTTQARPPPPSYESSQQSAFVVNGRVHAGSNGDSVQAQEYNLEQFERVNRRPDCSVSDAEVNSLIPPIPSSFPELDDMAMSELQKIVEDPVALKSYVQNRTRVDTVRELKESIEKSNVDAATANLEKQDKVNLLCDEVEGLRKQLGEKVERYQELDRERNALTQPPDVDDAIRRLNVAKKNADNESEEIGDDWVESRGSDVSDFVRKFMESRLVYHTRAAKIERLRNTMS
mmetsp:Transcript_35287/g.80659  ORF Transcript_35287/g.80659 Transcript_35287/m.80659 type:complete len:388 (-) Transcript_35287:295-1458(-)